eukprot:jgi/Tetstr1/460599/TSEL_000524.t1
MERDYDPITRARVRSNKYREDRLRAEQLERAERDSARERLNRRQLKLEAAELQFRQEQESLRRVCKVCEALKAEAWGMQHSDWADRRCGRCFSALAKHRAQLLHGLAREDAEPNGQLEGGAGREEAEVTAQHSIAGDAEDEGGMQEALARYRPDWANRRYAAGSIEPPTNWQSNSRPDGVVVEPAESDGGQRPTSDGSQQAGADGGSIATAQLDDWGPVPLEEMVEMLQVAEGIIALGTTARERKQALQAASDLRSAIADRMLRERRAGHSARTATLSSARGRQPTLLPQPTHSRRNAERTHRGGGMHARGWAQGAASVGSSSSWEGSPRRTRMRKLHRQASVGNRHTNSQADEPDLPWCPPGAALPDQRVPGHEAAGESNAAVAGVHYSARRRSPALRHGERNQPVQIHLSGGNSDRQQMRADVGRQQHPPGKETRRGAHAPDCKLTDRTGWRTTGVVPDIIN